MPTCKPRLPRRASIKGVSLAVLAACGALTVTNGAYAAAPFRGRPVQAVLTELAAAGNLQLVYTSAVVPPTAIQATEPTAGSALESIAQVLAPLGLQLRRAEGNIYSIVPQAEPTTPAVRALPAAGTPTTDIVAIVVTASRYSLATDVPEVHAFLSQRELEALPRLAEDALKAVHRLPGAASNGLSGLAHIRGGDTNETLVMFDGLPLYEPFHLRLLQSPSSVLDERIVESLDVYAGGFTAEYGDRMSAIIDARSLRPAADQYYELGLSLMHSTALAAQRFAAGRGQWLASIRRSNLDEVADILRSEIGEPTYLDGFVRVDYEWSPATRGSLHALLANDEAEINNSEETEHADASYSNTYLWGTLTHDWSEQWSGTALVSFTDVGAQREARVLEPGQRVGFVNDERDYDVL
ncbi:MAG: TonB-dependent receptor plug domain-containing protein, partial [Steroidobacteraceae bacterium]